MGIFSRKKADPQPAKEERQVNLGGLMYNGVSSFAESQSMKLSAVYCATNQISNSVGQLPIQIVKYDNDEKRPIEHPLWKLLNLSPDSKYNHFNLFKMAIESVILRGNAYFLIERDQRLNVKALHYISQDYVTPMLQEDGTVKYLVQGMDKAVDAVNMIHLWMHVDDMFNGISVIRYAYNCLKGATDAENAANKFYRGGAGLNGVLKASAVLTNDQKMQIRNSWNQAFTAEGSGVAVLPAGVDFQPVSISPQDAQLLDSREFGITEIARFFNISPIKLFQLDEVSYSSMESTELYYLADTIQPYCQMIEEEFNRKLFKPSEVGEIGIMFDFSAALKTNRQSEGEYYRMMITNGIMTLDEVRGKLGLPKIGNEIGTKHWIQISYASAEDIAAGKYIKQTDKEQNQQVDKKVKE